MKSSRRNTREEQARRAAIAEELMGDVMGAQTDSTAHHHGRNVQDASLASLSRTVAVTHETLEVAKETAVKIVSAGEKIEHMYDDLLKIEDAQKRSRQIIQRLIRRVVENKYLWCLIGLIVVGIVGIIVLKATS